MAGRPSYGWKSFAGILLMVVGVFNVIDGLTALAHARTTSRVWAVALSFPSRIISTRGDGSS